MRTGWYILVCLSIGILWGFAAPEETLGQRAATLRVLVTSADDGSPVEGANVILRVSDEQTLLKAGVTNRDGYHEITEIPTGKYIIEISHVGFASHRDTLRLEEGRRIYSVELAIEPGQLEELTIESRQRTNQPQAGRQRISASDLDRIPTPGPSGDLASYLQTLPGVVSVGDRGGQLFIQGGAPTQNRYLVDGLPIVQPFHISSFHSAFPQDIVQSADLYTGGFGAEYGEALSSVLDVRLRPGNMKRFEGSGSVGPHLTSLNVEGPLVQNEQSFLVSARYSLLDEAADPLYGRTEPISFYDVTGRYSLQQDDTTCNLTTVLTHDEGRLGPEEEQGLSWSNTVIGGRCYFSDEQFENTFSVRGGYTRFENESGGIDSPEKAARRWRIYFALDRSMKFQGRHPFNFGAYVTAGNYSAELDEQFVGLEALSRSQQMVRLHWSLEWDPNEYVTLTPSVAVRVEESIQPSGDPRLRLSVQPDGTDQQELSLAAGLYHQIDEGIRDVRDAGTAFTVWTPPKGDDPLPQAIHAIASYRHRLGRSLEASVEGYAKRLRDIPVPKWTARAGVNTNTTLAESNIWGADARVEYRSGSLYANLGYGWSTVTTEATTDDLGAWIGGDVFSFSPAHDQRQRINFVSSYEIGETTASLNWEFGTGRPFTQVVGFDLAPRIPGGSPTENPGTSQTIFERPFGARLPATHRLDVSVKRSFNLSDRIGLETEVGAINLYDRENVFFFDADQLQRINQSGFLPYISLTLRAE